MKIIKTNEAPKAIGPYSQAILVDKILFLSGQIALDPQTGKLQQGSIEVETERILANIDAILDEAGFRPQDVVKTTIFLTDMSFFGAVNRVYGAYFAPHKPARATVEVQGLPLGARIEIEAVAIKNG